MKGDFRWLLVLACNLILIFIMRILNDFLAPYSFSIFLGSLCILIPLLRLKLLGGLICVAATGWAIDCIWPIYYGLNSLLFSSVYIVLYWLYNQYNLSLLKFLTQFIQLTNVGLMLILGVILSDSLLFSFAYWWMIFLNTAVSAIVLWCISSWFIELQYSLLYLFSSKDFISHERTL